MKKLKIIAFTLLFMFLTLKLFSGKPEADEYIILPSTYGWFTNGEINISVHAWIFEPEEDSIARNIFVGILKDNLENTGIEEKQIFSERIRYFLTDNKRGKNIKISIMGEDYPLPRTAPDGHTLSVVKIKINTNLHSVNNRQSFSTIPGKKGSIAYTGTFQIIGEQGYSVISDIDDTIKESKVLDKNELFKNTFLRKFIPVKGMPQLYKKFEEKGAVFHYVSGSPWQLYPAINDFLQNEKFPEGSVDLKLFRIKDRSSINFIRADQLSYKIKSIRTIIDRFPKRKFILIGDSGEKDPEVYAEIAERYKERIKYIFIRDAGLIDENSSRRKKIIEKAGNVKLVIFKEPGELEQYTLPLN